MADKRPKRGQYKKFLQDPEEPIPKRSSSYYSQTSEQVNNASPCAEVNIDPSGNGASDRSEVTERNQRQDQALHINEANNASPCAEVNIAPAGNSTSERSEATARNRHQGQTVHANEANNASPCAEVNIDPSGNGASDRSEVTERNQHQDQALHANEANNTSPCAEVNIALFGSGTSERSEATARNRHQGQAVHANEATTGSQFSLRNNHHEIFPPVRMTVDNLHLNANPILCCNEEHNEGNTLCSDTEVEAEDLLTHAFYDEEADGQGDPGEGNEAEEQETLDGSNTSGEQGLPNEIEQEASISGDEDNNHQPFLAGHENLWDAIINDPSFTSPITTDVNSTPAEVLLRMLALREQNNFSFKAFVDTARLVNSLFVSPVVKGTQYMLDKLLMSTTGVSHYFYCRKCSFSFGKVDKETTPSLLCPDCQTDNPLKDLTKATYFVVFPLKSQLELLLMDEDVRNSLYDPKDAVTLNNDRNVLKDIFDSKCYKEFAASLPDTIGVKVISGVVCTDGSPLFKSSTFSIWPFFLGINELPPLIRMKNLLIGGLWFGNRHPPMELFLKPVVDNLSLLSDPGFELNVNGNKWKMKLYTIACCVDSGARGSVQGINSHSGYFSCNWCLTPGAWLDKMVFPFEEVPSPARSHNSIIEHGRECLNDDNLVYVYGVQYVSPLVALPKFDIVKGMVQDFPHNVPFGIARTFLDEWLGTSKRSFYIGSPDELAILNRKLACITPCLEVRRALRPLKDRANWKAREFENWILFYSLVILLNVLPPRFWTHWSFLVQASYMLSRQHIPTNNVNTAHLLIRHWVADVERLYGTKYMTFNVHIFSHLAENVSRWGPIWAVSTYCFEHAIGTLKNILHAQRGVAHQIERELSYMEAMKILMRTCSTARTEQFLDSIKSKPNKMTSYLPLEECVVTGKEKDCSFNDEERFLIAQSDYDINYENCVSYPKIIASRCVYTTDAASAGKKFNNSVALTKSGSIVIIKKFFRDKTTDNVFFFCVEADCRVFLKFPPGIRISPEDHCLRIIHSVGQRLKIFSVKDLDIICVYSEIDGKAYVTPFHNLYNTC